MFPCTIADAGYEVATRDNWARYREAGNAW
jgi:hypothetical protein